MDSAKRCTRLKKNFYIIKYIIYKKKVHIIFLKIFIKPKFLPEPKFRKEKTIFFLYWVFLCQILLFHGVYFMKNNKKMKLIMGLDYSSFGETGKNVSATSIFFSDFFL
jgi:hypothetical protein